MTRTPMAIASVDAQTCYDRIVHSIASICCQRWNVPLPAIISALKTIQKMKFYLRTSFGDSEAHYGGGETGLPFQGGCQGNGGAPALWVAVSVILVRILKQHGHVVEWSSAISGTVTTLIGFLYVDDTDLITMAPSALSDPMEVMEMMQDNITTWYKSLNHTGGALHPGKCSWYLLAYDWTDEGKWVYKKKTSLPGDITVPNLQGVPTVIDRHDPEVAIKAVGVTQAMDGSMDAQLTVLQDKAEEWADLIRKGWLPRNLAWAALRQNIWASLKYPLPACNFSPQEADSILRRFYKTMLPGLGVCCNISRAVRHAPRLMMGLDLPHVYTEQGIGQLKYFVIHAHLPNLMGSLHRACLEQANLEVGYPNIFELPFKKYGFLLTDCLTKSIWEFVSNNNIQLKGKTAGPQLQRDGDEFLTKLWVESNAMTQREIIGANRVRLDLQAVTVACISDGDGTSVCSWAYSIHKFPGLQSRWKFPREFPGSQDRTYWRKGLVVLHDPRRGFYSHRFQLGPWVRPPHRTIWQWCYDRDTRVLYGRFLDSYWRRFVPLSQYPPRLGSMFEREGFTLADPPDTAEYATAFVDHHGRARFNGSAPLVTAPPPQPPATVHEVATRWDYGWPLQKSNFPGKGDSIAQALIKGTAQGVCDGSYKPKTTDELGTAAWVIEDADRVVDHNYSPRSCVGVVRTTGTRREINAYRSELQGIHAILLAVKAICQLHNVHQGSIRLACDNNTGADIAAGTVTRVPFTRRHADLIRAIRAIKAELPVEVSFEHVYGHQDNETTIQDLPRLAQLNVHADTLAKEHLDQLIEHARTPGGLPANESNLEGEGWTIWLNGVKLTSDPTVAIRQHVHSSALRTYMAQKGLIAELAFDTIDWHATALVMEELSPSLRLWATKHVHGWSAVGRRMKQWKFWEDSTCPCCRLTEETT